MAKKNSKHNSELQYCSFCGRGRDEVALFFQGAGGANICNECIEIGYNSLKNNNLLSTAAADKKQNNSGFNQPKLVKPQQIKEFLDNYVIGQDSAKRTIAVAVYNHYKRLGQPDDNNEVEIEKSNIIMVGSTGTGKTLLARTIARQLKVPFTIVDATVFTEAGYVG